MRDKVSVLRCHGRLELRAGRRGGEESNRCISSLASGSLKRCTCLLRGTSPESVNTYKHTPLYVHSCLSSQHEHRHTYVSLQVRGHSLSRPHTAAFSLFILRNGIVALPVLQVPVAALQVGMKGIQEGEEHIALLDNLLPFSGNST
ncbi:hypothetical protein EXN66_Car021258 [Channa argus]|uniref:Uncharacterized protein n=1 Tax=Channa argus TaxID=215402 RepID=A0A6G1QSW0_CHAAH|nr:hypothetical protein EXN66_Car021258 [Channa argus]